MILNSDHCKLCDNKIMDFSRGTLCALTNERPDFNSKCSKIVLKNEFEKQITEINIEHDSVLKSKTNEIGVAIVNIAIGLGIMLVGAAVTYFIFKKGFISTVTIVIFAISSIPIGRGIGIINNYFIELKIAKAKKEKLDKVANFYGYDYNIDIEHIKDSLGNIEHKTRLKVLNIPTKPIRN